jgi:hypothetical protein
MTANVSLERTSVGRRLIILFQRVFYAARLGRTYRPALDAAYCIGLRMYVHSSIKMEGHPLLVLHGPLVENERSINGLSWCSGHWANVEIILYARRQLDSSNWTHPSVMSTVHNATRRTICARMSIVYRSSLHRRRPRVLWSDPIRSSLWFTWLLPRATTTYVSMDGCCSTEWKQTDRLHRTHIVLTIGE